MKKETSKKAMQPQGAASGSSKPQANAGAAKNALPAGKPKTGLSERDRNAIFAVLVAVALFAASYVIFFPPSPDNEADGSEFYARMAAADKVGLLYDARVAQGDQASAIYQCGVDMISKGRFVGKELENAACGQDGCIDSITGMNGTSRISFDEAQRRMSSKPYILIKAGAPSYKFFNRHMEISIGEDASGNVSCDISAIETAGS